MRIKLPRLRIEDHLLEFDDWITPTLGEIKDTEKFESEMQLICQALDALGTQTNRFASLGDTSPTQIAESVLKYIIKQQEDTAVELLHKLS